MKQKKTTVYTKWKLSLIEISVILFVLVLTITGLAVAIEDAVQLGNTINLHLAETVIINQGITNLQREIFLTHEQVLRQLSNLDPPTKKITRFVFARVQIDNLVAETKNPTASYIFSDEDMVVIRFVSLEAPIIDQFINELPQATAEERISILKKLDERFTKMESQIKVLVDIDATKQRTAINQTRASLSTSQITSFSSIGILIIMGVLLVINLRSNLVNRLDQAIEADNFKNQLLANISHELRTPINAIQGYAQLLSEGTYGELTNEQKGTIRRISVNAIQLLGMVNNLLDRAQLEQGKFTIRKAPFSPREFIETTHFALHILAKSKELTLTSEVAADVPQMLNGDIMRLQQILFNLTSNAIKFTEKGSVHSRIFIPEEGYWAIEVRDTGIGIPPQLQSKVFESFWQADSSATRKYRGTGLGLSIVEHIVQLMGGKITINSQPGKGSTFTVILPLEKIE